MTSVTVALLWNSLGAWSAESWMAESIEIISSDDRSIYEVAFQLPQDVTAATPDYTSFGLVGPNRYVIDIENAAMGGQSADSIPIEDNYVERIRYAVQPDGRLRLVFDLLSEPLRDRILVWQEANLKSATLKIVFANSPLSDAKIRGADSGSVHALAVEDKSQEPEDTCTGECTPVSSVSSAPQEAREPRRRTVPQSVVSDDGEHEEARSEDSDSESAGTVLVFGAPSEAESASPHKVQSAESWRWSAPRALFEPGAMDPSDNFGLNAHLQGLVALNGRLTDQIEAKVTARIDAQFQRGSLPELSWTKADYDESWLRFKGGAWTVTAGAQKILWGNSDEFAPTDRLSTRDFTRLILDDLEYRRRANLALRLEWLRESSKLDLVVLPHFREAELPDEDSIWYPINRQTGEIAGLPLSQLQQAALSGARLRRGIEGSAGFAARYTVTTPRWDGSLTLQRVHNPEPYFALEEEPSQLTPAYLRTVYPRTTVLGGDWSTAIGSLTIRAEAAWLSDMPYTRSLDFLQMTSPAAHWVLGTEVFPGDRNLRVTAQISGQHLLDADSPIDYENITNLSGEVETPFGSFAPNWRVNVRYSFRLDEEGSYLNPEISFIGFEPSELYLGFHLFDGNSGTAEGFYRRNDAVVLGIRAQF
ncbi:MAG: AMIN domain-containing protein [Pseudomonadota bacterium]